MNYKLSKIKPSNQSLWQTSRFLKNRNQLLPPIKINQNILITNDEKSKALSEQFAENHQNTLANNNTSSTNEVNDEVAQFITMPSDEPTVPNEEQIQDVICLCKLNGK